VSQAESDKRALDKLMSSRGWAILHDTMTKELVMAAAQIAENRSMTLDEINFRRGAIWAAQQLVKLPDTLIARLEGEIAMAKAAAAMAAPNTTTQPDAATAAQDNAKEE
jgi:hypothetical protein